MKFSALPVALLAIVFSGTTNAVKMQTTITTGSVLAPVIFTYLEADNGDYYPLGYFLDGCTSRGAAKSICRDTSNKRGHVIWSNNSKQCMRETSRDSIKDGKNSCEYITFTGVACTW